MKIKTLEMKGFKSFADKTEFNFDTGTTVIVGPNGCGKSNVVDSIKWVLGAQGPKALRGSEMADVIFNGAAKRKPLGCAEVSLYVSNEDKKLPIEFDEVKITRRLYRSGESEYLINNQTSRLKDIKDLFMDTGIGNDSYAIIEQGKIEKILQANPMGRRAVFEEAAGISKYKARKIEAERKLEKTTNLLARVNDVIRELEREIRSLKIHATKAKNYKLMLDEFKTLKLKLSINDSYNLNKELKAIQEQISAKKRDASSLEMEIDMNGQLIFETELALEDKSSSFAVKERALLSNQNKSDNFKQKIEENKLNIDEFENDTLEINKEIDSLENTIEKHKVDYSNTCLERDETEAKLISITQELASLENIIKEFHEGFNELSIKLSEKKDNAIEVVQKITDYNNKLAEIKTSIKQANEYRVRLLKKIDELEFDVENEILVVKAIEDEISLLKSEEENLSIKLDEDNKALENVKNTLTLLLDKLSENKNEYNKLKSRNELLIDLEKHMEGITAGVKAAMNLNISDGNSSTPKPLYECIEVDHKISTILETILSQKLQSLIVDNSSGALSIIKALKEDQSGFIYTIPADKYNPADNKSRWIPIPANPGIIGKLTHYIKCLNPTVAKFIHSELHNYILVKDYETLMDLIPFAINENVSVVSLDGTIVTGNGEIYGGNLKSNAGILSRKTEQKELENKINIAMAKINQLEQQKQNAYHTLQQLELNCKRKRQRKYELTITLTEKKAELQNSSNKLNYLNDEIELNKKDIQDYENSISSLSSKEAELVSFVNDLSNVKQTLDDEINKLKQESERVRKRREEMQANAEQKRIDFASNKQKLNALNNKLTSMTLELDRIKNSLIRAQNELNKKENKIALLSEENEDLTNQLIIINKKIETLTFEKDVLLNEISKLKNELEEMQQGNKEIELSLKDVEKNIAELKIKENSSMIKLQTLIDNVKNEFEEDLIALMQNIEDIILQPNEYELIKQKTNEIKQKLQKNNNINLSAIDELEEAEKRYQYNMENKQDLEDAKKKLFELIRKLNKESRIKFEQTMELIRKNFNSIFRKIFNGGKAEIVIEENENILEAGIDIIAKPPGKEMISLNLLSGGEKALTTLALIMGIFMIKPSPFCILDEVDAPLDENNVERLISLIKEFANETQFLVISHNKKTMSYANVIYGITMQEKGVSKKISVKFETADLCVA